MRARRVKLSAVVTLQVLFLLLFSIPGFSQNTESGGQAAAAATQNSETSSQGSVEDERAQFKHSRSVELLSKITGLSVNGAYWLAVVINFAIVVGAIAWFSKRILPGAFRNRTASIQKAIEEARRASEDANRRLSDIESRLGRLDQEISQMRSVSEQEAAAEEARIKAAAEEDARRIVQSAEQEISASVKAARRELTCFAAELAVSLAAKQIHVDAAADQALVRRFAQDLSNGGAAEKKS
jgi:F-type H+-transporting ATPase subunit b